MVDGAGGPISVDLLAFNVDRAPIRREGLEQQRMVTMQIEVNNNSNLPVTVKKISVDSRGMASFRLDTAVGGFNEQIDAGRSHVFTLTTRAAGEVSRRPEETINLDLQVFVTLIDDYTYKFTFDVPYKPDIL